MPIYEYRCASCGADLEVIQKFSDPPLVDCPSCGAPKLEKQLSQSSFALKGSGWYADGYGPAKTKESSGSESSSSDGSKGTSDKEKSTSKTAESAPPKEKPSVKASDSKTTT